MYEEVFEGMNYTNHEIAQMFDKTFEEDLTFSSENSEMCIRDRLLSDVSRGGDH